MDYVNFYDVVSEVYPSNLNKDIIFGHKMKKPAVKKFEKKILLCSLYGRSAMLQYASQLANALCKYQKVYVLIPDYSETMLFDKRVKLLKVKAPPNIIKTTLLSANLFTFYNLINKIRHINPDVIHFLDNHPWYVSLILSFKNKKFFVTQHDISSHPGEFFRGKITIWMNKILDRYATRIIVHGQVLKNELAKKVDKNKIAVYPHGDYSFFLKWKKKNVIEEAHTVLFFGRILKYKGLDILLKSAPLVIKKVPDLKIIIAGEGDMTPYKKFISPDLEKHLEIINKYLPERDIPILFQRSSIVVMPYREASQSGVIPIAYAFKKAIVCTDVGSISEVIENEKTGILIRPDDEKLLAETLSKLLLDARYRKFLGVNGYHKMLSELSWDAISKKLIKEYDAAYTKV